jgi:hypothetical protein
MKAVPAHNPEIAQSLDDIADLLELERDDVINTRTLVKLRPLERTMRR